MGFLQRLLRLEDDLDPVRVAIAGADGEARKKLEAAYGASAKAEIVYSGGADNLEREVRVGNVELVEIFAPTGKRAELARVCLEAGANVSLAMPPAQDSAQIDSLKTLAAQRGKFVRVRNECLYYEPYQKARELIQQEKIGWPVMLRLVIKRKRAPENGFDRAAWLCENESASFALAEYLYGPLGSVFTLGGKSATNPGSILTGLKFKTQHSLGFMLLDFVPDMQMHTLGEPVFRQAWATGTNGVLMINRGEAQLRREPVLLLRVKDYSRTWEMLKDDWNLVYPVMAEEAFTAIRKNLPVVSGLDLAERAVRATLKAGEALKEGKELAV